LFSHLDLPPRPTTFLPRGVETAPPKAPPPHDVPTPENGLFSGSSSKDVYGETCANAIWYPPGGWMDWHTNSNNPGKRLYVAWSETGESGMRWFRDGQVFDDPDQPGWNVRIFDTPEWHMVYARCWRYSIGWHV